MLDPSSVLVAALLAAAPPARPVAAPQEPDPGARGQAPRGLVRNEPGAFQGYTLIAPLSAREVVLVDMQGEVVHRWQVEGAPGTWSYLLPDGRLLHGLRVEENPMFHGGGIGGRLQMLEWDGTVVWDYTLANEYQTLHHDVEPLPNGNLLAIVWEHRFPEDALEWGRERRTIGTEGLWPDAVLELKPVLPDGAEVVWEWHAWDHVVQDADPEKPGYGSIPDLPGRIDINGDHRDRPPESAAERQRRLALEKQMRALGYVGGEDEEDDAPNGQAPAAVGGERFEADWLHTNGIDYNAELDLIVLSTPHMNELWVIDHSTTTEQASVDYGGRFDRGGDLLWRWGNPRVYGLGTDLDRRLFYQHNPTWIAGERPGEVRLLVYNNGGGRKGGDFSSVDELVLPFDPERGFQREPGQAFGPAEPAWSFSDPDAFFSAFISGCQRLPNGNTLVCEGVNGRVFEVTRAGEVVWEYLNPIQGDAAGSSVSPGAPPLALFRAERYAPDHPALAGRL